MIQQDTTNTDSSWVKHIRCTGTKWSPGESVDCGFDRSVCDLGPIGGGPFFLQTGAFFLFWSPPPAGSHHANTQRAHPLTFPSTGLCVFGRPVLIRRQGPDSYLGFL